jgi:hypothetical protein
VLVLVAVLVLVLVQVQVLVQGQAPFGWMRMSSGGCLCVRIQLDGTLWTLQLCWVLHDCGQNRFATSCRYCMT